MRQSDAKARSSLPASATFIGVASGVVVLAIYLLRLDRTAGLIYDDAWYVLFGQALARGEGYTLANAPTPGILPPNYPPGFAAILSIVFALTSGFPGNVLLLKAVSVIAMMAVGVVSYRYFLHYRKLPQPLALALAVAVVITPAFVFLATSTVMSECVFTLVQLLAIVVLDRSVSGSEPRRDTILAGALAAASVLIRTAGTPIPIAGMLYLLAGRRWRQVSIYAATVLLCLAPWWGFARMHALTMEERIAHGGDNAFTYVDAVEQIRASNIPGRVKDGLVDVFGRDVAAIVTPALFRGASESGEEVISVGGGLYPNSMGSATGTMIVSYLFSALAALGFAASARRGATAAEFVMPLALGMIVLWPWPAYRFVLPFTPFLFYYLIAGLRTLTPALPVARVAVLCVIGLNLADHAEYILRARTETLDWAADAQEVDELFNWMNQQLTETGYVATTNPALVYLRTGRRTVAIGDPQLNWEHWKSMGVRYLVSLRTKDFPAPYGPYKVLYQSKRLKLWVIEI